MTSVKKRSTVAASLQKQHSEKTERSWYSGQKQPNQQKPPVRPAGGGKKRPIA